MNLSRTSVTHLLALWGTVLSITTPAIAAPPNCSMWDNSCNIGVYNQVADRCEPAPINEDGACDDEYECTVTDTCIDGVCTGSGCTNPSLCLEADEGCFAFPGASVRIELGDSDLAILGGQFSIKYDPSVLTFSSMSPGSTCNPASPFTTEIFETVDQVNGEIFYAVGVNPFESGPFPRGAATMACLSFSTTGSAESELCLVSGLNPFDTRLVDETGKHVAINPQACAAGVVLPTISCDNVTVDVNCVCTAGNADCGALTTTCRTGVCNEFTGQCQSLPTNEGEPCDDGESCTGADMCMNGVCVGLGCRNPSLCVVAQETCIIPENVFPGTNVGKVAIRLGAGAPVIFGGQFSVQYDPAVLDFVDIAPGIACDQASPFVSELLKIVDEVNGKITYTVAAAITGSGTQGPATMACLTFVVNEPSEDGICLLSSLDPFNTLLITQDGESIAIHNALDCPTSLPSPILSCDNFCIPIPTISTWGLVLMSLLLLTAAKVYFGAASRLGPRQAKHPGRL